MNPPDSITIGPHTYRVIRDEAAINTVSRDERCDLLGITDPTHTTITLRPDQSPSMLADTLLHETLHALTSLTGITNDIDDEESVINRLAPALLDCLRRNPALVKYLTAP